jgi:hypothetical protein
MMAAGRLAGRTDEPITGPAAALHRGGAGVLSHAIAPRVPSM